MRSDPYPFNPTQREWEQVPHALRDLYDAGVERWPLLLAGPPGRGKTCAALAMLDRAGSCGRRYYTLGEAVQEATDAIFRRGEYSFGELFRRPHGKDRGGLWRRLGMVVIDEVGLRQEPSASERDTLKSILDAREGKPTVFCTNMNAAQIAEAYDDRIASRLTCGTVFKFSGKDLRLSGRVVIGHRDDDRSTGSKQ